MPSASSIVKSTIIEQTIMPSMWPSKERAMGQMNLWHALGHTTSTPMRQNAQPGRMLCRCIFQYIYICSWYIYTCFCLFVLVLFCVCFCHCSSQTYASNGLELAQQYSYALTIASQTLHVPQPQLDARGRSRSKMYAKGECAISCAGWFPATMH